MVQRILDDYTTAPIDEKLRATLGLLRKMTLAHGELVADDVRVVLKTGLSKEAIEEALEVAFLFNIYDRLADTMGWDVPERHRGFYETAAKRLLSRGYKT